MTKEVGSTAVCELCGKEFIVRNCRQRYCCRKCSDAAYSAGLVQKRYSKHEPLSDETMSKKAKKVIRQAGKPWKPVERELKSGETYRDIQIREMLEKQAREIEERRRRREGAG